MASALDWRSRPLESRREESSKRYARSPGKLTEVAETDCMAEVVGLEVRRETGKE
jgi:hypothetical protein